MTTPTTGTLALPVDATPTEAVRPATTTAPLLRPADLVTALTGVALAFFAFFVYAITEWRFVSPGVEQASVLGWLAPLVAGAVCLASAVVSVVVRAARRASAAETAE